MFCKKNLAIFVSLTLSAFNTSAISFEQLVSDAKSKDIPHSTNNNSFSSAAAQAPTLQSGSSKIFKSGTCNSGLCKIADSSWFCSLSGVGEQFRYDRSRVYLKGGYWYSYRATVGSPQYTLNEWSCFK